MYVRGSLLGAKVSSALTTAAAATTTSSSSRSSCHACRQLSSSATLLGRRRLKRSPLATVPPYEDSMWNVKVAVCLARPPVVVPVAPDWMQGWVDTLQGQTDEQAIPSKHELRMDRFRRLRLALEKRAAGETVTEFTEQELASDEIQGYEDIIQLEENERANLPLGPRVTQDDKDNVLTSNNRLLDRYLYMVVRHKDELLGWNFPQATVDGTIALREEAAKIIEAMAEPKLEYSIYSNAPAAVMTLRHKTDDGKNGSKVFIFSATVQPGENIDTYVDPAYTEHRWLLKENLCDLMGKTHFSAVNGMLLP